MDDVPTENGNTGTAESDKQEVDASTLLNARISKNRRVNQFNYFVEASAIRVLQEEHLNRLTKLRKELNFIKQTEWQYEPIEKYIGQS